jgi:8-oxo-dGTP pyrophosphatase MutT (NUDIX family)
MDLIVRQLKAYQPDNEEVEHTAACIQLAEEGPISLYRSRIAGHFTASAWVVSPDFTQCLLLHHSKLDRWLQAGGHADGNENLMEVAKNELTEETGLYQAILFKNDIFDLDVHKIPLYKNVPEHYHFDLRFLFTADPNFPLVGNEESRAIRWFSLEEAQNLTNNVSIHRMIRKTKALQ